jgi:CRISPR-associated protein Csd1
MSLRSRSRRPEFQMILQSLHVLYDRLASDKSYDIAEPGFSPQKISFRIVLNLDGLLFTIEDARVKSESGKLVPARMRVPGEAKSPGSGTNPGFLWDNQTYLLGRQPDDKPREFGSKRFDAFRQRHLDVEKTIDHPSFSAVCRFLEQWKPGQIEAYPVLLEVGTGFGVFQLVGDSRPVHEVEAIRSWWRSNLPKEGGEQIGQCLLTGKITAIARLHPKIKGVIGAQAAGASLVSFNDSAYESYGKEQSYNSPVGEDAAFRYGAALNALLNSPQAAKHRIRIGDATCVFWTDKKTILEDIFAAIAGSGDHVVEETQDQQLRAKINAFLKALQQGREAYGELADDPNVTRFYLLGLSPNAARLSVRFFYQSSIRELLDHLRRHKMDIEIAREFEHPVGKRRADSEFPAYWEFLRETVRQGDDPPPLLGGALMRAILEGTRYPESLFAAIIRRVQMERSVSYLRAAAIKAVLTRNHNLAITTMLDPTNTQPAYLLGRLFAVLEKIQEEGHRDQTGGYLDKTIRDTYFSAACATPASVFPRLEQLSTHHRRHLNPGRKVQFDQLIADIKWPLSPDSPTPTSQNLKAQGLFILGYYHQRKDLFTRKEKPIETPVAA